MSRTSKTSMRSFKSGSSQRSDVDRLIDAISEPNMIGRKNAGDQSPSSQSLKPPLHKRHSMDTSQTLRMRSKSVEHLDSRSLVTPPHQRSMTSKIPGEERVASSSAPLRAVRMPDEASSPTEAGPPGGLIMGEVHEEPKEIAPAPETETLTAEHFRVLVAEDDPVNSRIVKKRLEKLGHNVYLTVNGEECASAFCDNPRDFDVVLMDMQVSKARYNTPCSSLTVSQDANR
jgi:CheY-like chemotaxis protein